MRSGLILFPKNIHEDFPTFLFSRPLSGYRYFASHTKVKGSNCSTPWCIAGCDVEVSIAEDTDFCFTIGIPVPKKYSLVYCLTIEADAVNVPEFIITRLKFSLFGAFFVLSTATVVYTRCSPLDNHRKKEVIQ